MVVRPSPPPVLPTPTKMYDARYMDALIQSLNFWLESLRSLQGTSTGGGTEFITTSETVTSGAAPITVDPAVFDTVVTTGGTGSAETIELPTTLGPEDAGTMHRVRLAVQTDPGDYVILGNSDIDVILSATDRVSLHRWTGVNWAYEGGYNNLSSLVGQFGFRVFDNSGTEEVVQLNNAWDELNNSQLPGTWKTLATIDDGNNPAEWRDRGGHDVATYEYVDMAVTTTVDGYTIYASYILTDGSGSANVLSLGGALASGQRKSITYIGQTDPGDTLTVSVTNVRNANGTTPASVTFASLYDELTVEYLAGSGLWFIVAHLTTATVA